jgi:pre-rRNA-processing protein TSR3
MDALINSTALKHFLPVSSSQVNPTTRPLLHLHIEYSFLIKKTITGFPTYAHSLMSRFSWGHAFYALNADLFEAYAGCSDSASIVACQNALLGKLEEEKARRKGLGGSGGVEGGSGGDLLLVENLNRVGGGRGGSRWRKGCSEEDESSDDEDYGQEEEEDDEDENEDDTSNDEEDNDTGTDDEDEEDEDMVEITDKLGNTIKIHRSQIEE